jgi:hypothetical protein
MRRGARTCPQVAAIAGVGGLLVDSEVPKWATSSAGRAPGSQSGGRRFDPGVVHHPPGMPPGAERPCSSHPMFARRVQSFHELAVASCSDRALRSRGRVPGPVSLVLATRLLSHHDRRDPTSPRRHPTARRSGRVSACGQGASVALTPFQRDVCRLLADNRIRSGESYVAGAAALNELLHAPRRSRDIDLFHDTEEALAASWKADRSSLDQGGYALSVLRERPTFVEAGPKCGGDMTSWSSSGPRTAPTGSSP